MVGEDETAEVGSELAVIAGEGESAGSAAPAAQDAGRRAGAGRAGHRADGRRRAAPPPGARAGRSRSRRPPPASAGEGTAVKMPALGESVTEGTVTRWLKQVGDTVEVDEPLLEVSTDKVDTEIPSPVAGTVLEIKVAEDETAAVGADLAIIGAAGAAPAEPAPEPRARPEGGGQARAEGRAEAGAPGRASRPRARRTTSRPPRPSRPAQPAKAEQAAQPAAPTAAPARRRPPAQGGGEEAAGYVTPLVRKLAAEHGVDLASLNGTGVGGRIRKQDVLEAAEKAKAAKAAPAAAPAAAAAAAPAKPAAKPQPSPHARPHREAAPDPRGHRQADGRVAARYRRS